MAAAWSPTTTWASRQWTVTAVELWRDAFAPCDVIVMTVHPPRKNGVLNVYDEGFFHVSNGWPGRRSPRAI